MSEAAGDEERSLVEFLMGAVKRHHFIPVGMGSGRAELVHELHALYHQWYMETGDPQVMAAIGNSCVAVATDKGTEHGVSAAPPAGCFFCNISTFLPHVLLRRRRRSGPR